MKALLLENIHPDGVRLLTERGITVESVPGALDEGELIAALSEVQLLGIRSKTAVTRRVLEAAPDLLAVGRVLHRHQPDRPGRGGRPRHRGVQRAILQHP